MNIYTVRDNLIRTIEGKEALLERYEDSEISEVRATAGYLRINLVELRNILADVEQCCENATAQSWQGVDRQGGI